MKILRSPIHFKAAFILILAIISVFLALVLVRGEDKQPPQTDTEKSVGEYKSLKDNYLRLAQEEGPKAALQALSRDMTRNDTLARYCHPIAHELGHFAYDKSGDFDEALKYTDELCNSGFVHGVIESYMSARGQLPSPDEVCGNHEDDTFFGWQCYHGLGHGFMFVSQNDLPDSINRCKELDTSFRASACANGVFMENFNTEQKEHLSKYLNATDPSYPCYEQDPLFAHSCFIYAPSYHIALHSNYAGSLEWCAGLAADYVGACASGVGYKVMKDNLNNPSIAEGVCLRAGEHIKDCIAGVTGFYILHTGSGDEGYALCGKMGEKTRSFCIATVENYKW